MPILQLKRWELLVIIVGIAGLLGVQFALSRSLGLLDRLFWLDEIYTYMLVADPHLSHSMRALAAGVETHPPAYYLVLRAFTTLAGGTNERTLRLFSLLCTFLALVGVYVYVRQSFRPVVSFTALWAVWCHPLVLTETFDARFYAPWLAGIVWFAYFLARSRNRDGGLLAAIGLAVCAIFVATVHYFGIVSLLLVIAGEQYGRWAAGCSWKNGWLGTTLGILAFIACIPLLINQRSATTVATWVHDADWSTLSAYVAQTFLHRYFAWAVLALWLAHLFLPLQRKRVETSPPIWDVTRQAGLTALAAMPLVMLFISFTIQPVVMPRYTIPVAAAFGPAMAFVLSGMPRSWNWVVCALILWAGARELSMKYDVARERDVGLQLLMQTVYYQTEGKPVVFESPDKLYVVCHYVPELANRCFLLDFEIGQIGFAPRSRIFVRDLSRRFAQFYPKPELKSWSELSHWKRLYLIPSFIVGGDYQSMMEGPYPAFLVHRVSDELYELIQK